MIVSANEFSEPRIEPEIMFGLGSTPTPAVSDTALIDCIEWIALGYEIVQSLTVAMPVKPGESWTTRVLGIPLEEITIRFE